MSNTFQLLLSAIFFCIASIPNAVNAQSNVSIRFSTDTVLIYGTKNNDDIRVWTKANGLIGVRANFTYAIFDPTIYTQVYFDGYEGDDRFRADADVLSIANGGSGDDRLMTVRGPAVFDGEAGSDELIGGPLADYLAGGTGDDNLYGYDGEDEIEGGPGYDLIVGGRYGDLIEGGTQDDIIFGQGGWDMILGNNGFDIIYGGNGNDQLDGGRGGDSIYGGASDDIIVGFTGDDILNGGRGNDIICGGDDDDAIRGELDDDRLYGEGGIDLLIGGAGINTTDDDTTGPCGPIIPVYRLPRHLLAELRNFEFSIPDIHTTVVDSDNDGNGNPFDTFQLRITFTNGPTTATGVRFGQSFTTTGPAFKAGATGVVAGTVAPHQVVSTSGSSNAFMILSYGATVGDQIFVEFDVTADGQTKRYRAGPFIVGEIDHGQREPATLVD